jgi:hypothetical protein
MKSKIITRIVLLTVVAASVGAWALKEFGPAKSGLFATDATAAPSAPNKPAPAAITRPDGVTVIHFHGEKRCPTCIRIGDLAKKTLDEAFAAELQAGKVRWESIDYSTPGNDHFVKDYELVSATVVATLWKDGKEIQWNRLDAVWDHVDDEATFRAYIDKGVRDLLNRP